jgi:hypothetical protein
MRAMHEVVVEKCENYAPMLAAAAAAIGYAHVLVRNGLFKPLSDAVKDEIIRQVAFYGALGLIAGAILDYA